MRAFDSKDEGTHEVMAGAPRLLERLDGDDAEHFEAVRSLLDANGVAYEIDDTLVRGLDYYTRTVFELDCAHLGAQSQIGGGGRYDRLVQQVGGPATPAAGWAAGHREDPAGDGRGSGGLRASRATPSSPPPTPSSAGGRWPWLPSCETPGSRPSSTSAAAGLKGQLKQADRIGARATVILEEDGSAQLRDMQSGEQSPLDPAAAIERLEELRRDGS